MFKTVPINGAGMPDRTLVLTYDDGPGPNTLPIAEYLRAKNIMATFFVIGKHARERPEGVVRVQGLGHRIGNHTWSHLDLIEEVTNGRDVVADVRQSADLLTATPRPIAFRAPGGAWNPDVADALNGDATLAAGHVGPFCWDIEGRDWEAWRTGSLPAAVAERYLAEARTTGRGIVLLHDSSADGPEFVATNRTYELTRVLVPLLIADGFRFVPLDAVPV